MMKFYGEIFREEGEDGSLSVLSIDDFTCPTVGQAIAVMQARKAEYTDNVKFNLFLKVHEE